MASADRTNHPVFDEPPVDHPSRRRLPPILRRAWYSLNQAFRRRIAHLDITPDQFTVLRWLNEAGGDGLTQRELADLMASDPNTVTSVLNRMESAGLIDRKPHETDRRAKLVTLKTKGRKAYEAARDIACALQGSVMSAIPESRRAAFLEQLEKIADAARAAAEQADD
jgi:DNA-binding MarR family transcriptional regulator